MSDDQTQAEDLRHDDGYNGPYGELNTSRLPQQAPISEEAINSFFRPVHNAAGERIGDEINHPHAQRPEFPGEPMPSRVPGETLIHPRVREHGIPSFGTGLNWLASAQSPIRGDLVNFDFAHVGGLGGFDVSNIELRTIYAHLLETAGRVRAEMRERGMQVDL